MARVAERIILLNRAILAVSPRIQDIADTVSAKRSTSFQEKIYKKIFEEYTKQLPSYPKPTEGLEKVRA
jgi:hypothetical protein